MNALTEFIEICCQFTYGHNYFHSQIYNILRAFAFRFLKNLSFYTLKSYFIYFTIQFHNLPYILDFILTHNSLKKYKLSHKKI